MYTVKAVLASLMTRLSLWGGPEESQSCWRTKRPVPRCLVTITLLKTLLNTCQWIFCTWLGRTGQTAPSQTLHRILDSANIGKLLWICFMSKVQGNELPCLNYSRQNLKATLGFPVILLGLQLWVQHQLKRFNALAENPGQLYRISSSSSPS